MVSQQQLTSAFSTFMDVIDYRSATQPNDTAYTFIEGEQETGISYKQLRERSMRLAMALKGYTKPGDKVLILQQPGLEYIYCFFGCLYAGCTAVPAYPPLTKRYAERVRLIAADSEAQVALVSAHWIDRVAQALQGEGLHYLATEPYTIHANGSVEAAIDRRADDIAFIQYTSGSTSNPKGVMVTHRNLIHNSEVIRQAFRLSERSVGLVWLPPYHDMGLIGGILQPVYTGFPIYLFPPNDFVQDPSRWLAAISKYRVTVSGGPNFAYELCNRKIAPEKLEQLDLSAWELAFTGAEHVQASVMRDFYTKFAVCGFQEKAIYPCYGLAESTLLVTGGFQGEGPSIIHANREKLLDGVIVCEPAPSDETAEYVACGSSYSDQRLLIVDPGTSIPCAEDRVGEVWVRSESKAAGYLNQPELTERVFQASLSGTEQGGFLRTGDLGFLLQDRLYITGRIKEMIIIRGKNYYPADMEFRLERADDRFIADGCAAFAVSQQGAEQLVIVQELSRHHRSADTSELAQKVRGLIAGQFGIQAYDIVFIKQGGLQKTSSGKKMRNACKDSYLAGALNVIESHRLANGTQEWGPDEAEALREEGRFDADELIRMAYEKRTRRLADDIRHYFAYRLRMEASLIGPQTPLLELGLDSVAALELQYRLEESLRIKISLEALLATEATVESIARDLSIRLTEPGQADITAHAIERVGDDKYPLSEDQQRLWFVEQLNAGQATLHIPVAVRVKGPLDKERLKQAMLTFASLHETLRSGFEFEEGRVLQVVREASALDAAWHYIDRAMEERSCEQTVRDLVAAPFDLTNGPLFRFAAIRIDHDEHVVMAVLHHLIADLKSAFILLNGVLSRYSRATSGTHSDPSVRYIDFLHWNRDRLSDSEIANQLNYWREQLTGAPPLLELPSDYDRPSVPSRRGGQFTFEIARDTCDKIRAFSKSQGVTPYVTLLSGYALMLHLLAESADFVIGTPVSGRRSRRLEEAIGFYAQPLPLRFQLKEDRYPFVRLLAYTKQAVLAALDNQDVSFSKLVEMVNPERTNSFNPIFQVLFSYLNMEFPDERPAEWRVSPYSVTTGVSEFDFFLTLIDSGQTMTGGIDYNSDLFELKTVESFAGLYLEIMETMIEKAAEPISEWGLSSLADIRRSIQRPSVKVEIASSFTSEFVEDSLAFWFKEMGLKAQLSFTPYNQVFQQLLQPDSEFATNREGINVALVRLSDLVSGEEYSAIDLNREKERLRENVLQFIDALELFQRRCPSACIVAICPESPTIAADHAELLTLLEAIASHRLGKLSSVYLLLPGQLSAGYGIADYYDKFAEKMSHTPYTYPYFACIGTALARKISSLTNAPKKVIVLDCDNTIWSGVCAEDGAEGVELDARSLYLQQFVLEQHRQGMLVCLCSKNVERDVWRVFDTRTDMPLKREHITAYRINWEAKSANVSSLAAELSLSVDSFIVFDDNPIECAEIEANCPDAFVIRANEPLERFRSALERLWIFDRAKVSEEDLRRNQMYKENAEREKFIRSMSRERVDYRSFIAGLQLEVACTELAERQVARVSQLTYRTNQFNSTGIRKKEEELLQLLQGETERCLVVRVKDRFGDYGLVGSVFYYQAPDALIVNGWMLSCRVLGKGVEHQILMQLGKLAAESTKDIVIEFVPTDRNKPFFLFVAGIAGVTESRPTLSSDATHYRVPAASIAGNADAAAPIGFPDGAVAEPRSTDAGPLNRTFGSKVNETLTRLDSVEELLLAIQKTKIVIPAANEKREYAAPRNDIEEKVAAIWRELLQLERVGIHDHFFFIGGHSLVAHQVLYKIRDAFGIELPLNVLFQDDFTVANVSAEIEKGLIEQADLEELKAMALELEGLSEEEIRQLLGEHSNN